jgi:hypothetical protein
MLMVCLCGAITPNASAQTQFSQLAGWVYHDRNNDGQLAFANQPDPEFALPGVTINLFMQDDNGDEPAQPTDSVTTDAFGRFIFSGLLSGTYSLRQVQPIEFLDGKDTLGTILNPVPPGSFPGTKIENAFIDIELVGGAQGDFYLFGERGLLPQYVSKRYLLSSTPPLNVIIPEPAAALTAVVALLAGWALRRSSRAAALPA